MILAAHQAACSLKDHPKELNITRQQLLLQPEIFLT